MSPLHDRTTRRHPTASRAAGAAATRVSYSVRSRAGPEIPSGLTSLPGPELSDLQGTSGKERGYRVLALGDADASAATMSCKRQLIRRFGSLGPHLRSTSGSKIHRLFRHASAGACGENFFLRRPPARMIKRTRFAETLDRRVPTESCAAHDSDKSVMPITTQEYRA